MNKHTFKYKGLKINPLSKKWRSKFEVIKILPMKTLRKLYRFYYEDSSLGFNREGLYYKISYAYQAKCLKLRKKEMTKKLKIRTEQIMKSSSSTVKLLVEELLGFKFHMKGGDKKMAKAKVKAKKDKVKKASIASRVYAMIKEGLSDEKIIAKIKKEFPKSKINKVHMNWYRHQLEGKPKKKGKPAPPLKKGKAKKAVEEDEDEDEDEEDEEEEDEDEDEE